MRHSLLAGLFVIGVALTFGMAAAEAKGGRGLGHGGGFKTFKVQSAPPGWSKGRKVGWRGRGCPPGLWKQGRC